MEGSTVNRQHRVLSAVHSDADPDPHGSAKGEFGYNPHQSPNLGAVEAQNKAVDGL
jgi:hypothetical protein